MKWRNSGSTICTVWIVQHDEHPDNTVLGVFASPGEADAFVDEIKGQFPKGVICSEFPVGYRYTDGAARYRTIE